MDGSKLVSTTMALSAGLLALLLVLSLALWGTAMALGVLVGGVLMLGNFHVLGWTVRRVLSPDGAAGSAGGFLAMFLLKFVVLAGVLSLAIWTGRVHILGLLLGCSVVVLAVLLLAPILGVTGLREEETHGERT